MQSSIRNSAEGARQGQVESNTRPSPALRLQHLYGGGCPFSDDQDLCTPVGSFWCERSEDYSLRDSIKISASCLFSFLLLLGNDGLIRRWLEWVAMKNETLKSTTVRFTESDLELVESLQEKLGLGMIHVIRLAIRRLAENENLLPFPATPKKR